MTTYRDLGDLLEDERIRHIGKQVMRMLPGAEAGFFVEDEEKANRYMQKLTENFPLVELADMRRIPEAANMVLVRIRKKKSATIPQ